MKSEREQYYDVERVIELDFIRATEAGALNAFQARMWPRDEEERRSLTSLGLGDDLTRVFHADDLAHGQNIIFCATGISDSSMLQGVRLEENVATTHSILMRAKTGTVRYVTTHHDLCRKMIRLRSDNREHLV